MGAVKAVLLIIVTIFIPPVGVFLVAGCGLDLLLNIVLTIFGYIPGHIHAFYLEYMYYKRKEEVESGTYTQRPAPLVFSDRVLQGGRHRPLATVPEALRQNPHEPVPGGQGQPGQPLAGQPLAGQPLAGQPLAGQPLAGQPLHGQSAPGQVSGQIPPGQTVGTV